MIQVNINIKFKVCNFIRTFRISILSKAHMSLQKRFQCRLTFFASLQFDFLVTFTEELNSVENETKEISREILIRD